MLGLFLTLIDGENEKAKFIDFYNKYKNLMFYIAKEILNDNYLAEDAVQESFLRIAKNFHKINDVLCPQTRNFTVIITRNVSFTMRKKNNTVIELDTYKDSDLPNPSSDPFESISVKILTENILKISEEYRDILYLYHLYGYSFKEISGLLSLPVETVKKRAQRARHILKQLLEKEGYYHE